MSAVLYSSCTAVIAPATRSRRPEESPTVGPRACLASHTKSQKPKAQRLSKTVGKVQGTGTTVPVARRFGRQGPPCASCLDLPCGDWAELGCMRKRVTGSDGENSAKAFQGRQGLLVPAAPTRASCNTRRQVQCGAVAMIHAVPCRHEVIRSCNDYGPVR